MSERLRAPETLSSGPANGSEKFSGETTVEACGISKVYWDGGRPLQVLKNVSLTVQKGQGVAILGPSGCGKTTLLNILGGLDTPGEGSVRLCGRDLGSMSENARADLRHRRLGFVFQFYHLLPEFTALENMMLPAMLGAKRNSEKKIREKAVSLLKKVGLGDRAEHHPSQLSGGEQQRAAIARALMNDPDILFCDEPTGNLDPETGAGVVELIKSFYEKEKKTVLVVTHDVRLAKMATKVWNIVKGQWE